MLCAGIGMLCWPAVILVALFVGSALLRAGIALANRTIGTEKTETIIGWDWDSEEEDDEIAVKNDKPPIPEPGVGRGMAIVFLVSLVDVVIGFLLSVLFDGPAHLQDWPVQVASYLVGLTGGFVVLMGLLAGMLPTSPKRAALAALYTYLIVIGLAILVAGFAYAVIR